MKIAIVGAGAMGCLFAWQLVKAGADVVAIDPWKEHIDAIRSNGLVVEKDGGTLNVPLTAVTSPADVGPCDVVMFFVKYGHTAKAAQMALPLVGDNTLLVTLQNGIGNPELIAEAIPDNPVAYGLTTLTSEMLGAGRIEASFSGRGETYFWRQNGQPDARDTALHDLLNKGDYAAALDPEIDLRIWKKLIINCCFNPICGLLDCNVGETMVDEEAALIFDGLISELATIAHKKDIDITTQSARDYLNDVGRDAASHIPSMTIDLRAGRITEIDCLNGAIVREGVRQGISTPTHTLVCNLIRMRENIAQRRSTKAA
ncbi:ketopantoate reductase family protein [Lentibacter sp. XHP0401]|uniref:ketopantoate reductase family protein n=1 Tax=Lentibacter sp. XHP0401 TaxID=2984334 RepID=UPI0021E7C37A|nr:2-dehydropantoate 2-reductase [Lentibacter sp. XHP0401]MCV2892722.1 2-dehydropantoate 2-reductase [Lentibacter sp. XHP0401]